MSAPAAVSERAAPRDPAATFLWMIQKAKDAGLAFDENWIRENIQPNAFGDLRDSKTGLYKLTGDFHRPIGIKLGGNESIHPEVINRYKNDSRYRPDKLVEYLESASPRNR